MTAILSTLSVETPGRLCGGCGIPNPRSWRFCRACGWDASSVADLDQHLILPTPVAGSPVQGAIESAGSCLGSLFRWGIYLAILGIILAILIPPRRHTREPAREKACYANMRVVLGAVEMYNMDHSIMVSTINDTDLDTDGFLVRGQYLKSRINRPETDCRYGTIGDLTRDGKIICARHGTVEE